MVLGIGVDTVSISRIEKYISSSKAFYTQTFSEKERQLGEQAADSASYFAARFAAKEAVFKALAHLTEKKRFELQIVETLNDTDGHPYVNINVALAAVMLECKVDSLHISITTEDPYATAFVIACRA